VPNTASHYRWTWRTLYDAAAWAGDCVERQAADAANAAWPPCCARIIYIEASTASRDNVAPGPFWGYLGPLLRIARANARITMATNTTPTMINDTIWLASVGNPT
jgi:hypothetical protein